MCAYNPKSVKFVSNNSIIPISKYVTYVVVYFNRASFSIGHTLMIILTHWYSSYFPNKNLILSRPQRLISLHQMPYYWLMNVKSNREITMRGPPLSVFTGREVKVSGDSWQLHIRDGAFGFRFSTVPKYALTCR